MGGGRDQGMAALPGGRDDRRRALLRLARRRSGPGVHFVGIHLSAVVAIVAGIRINRPAYAIAWWLIAAGEAVYAVANVIWYLYTLGFDVELPFPSVADAIYIPAYVMVLGGIGMLMWSGRATTGPVFSMPPSSSSGSPACRGCS